MPTPIGKKPKKPVTGSTDSTKPTLSTSEKLKLEKIDKKIKKPKPKPVPLDARTYFIGQIMAGILARSDGPVNWDHMRHEAEEAADRILEDLQSE